MDGLRGVQAPLASTPASGRGLENLTSSVETTWVDEAPEIGPVEQRFRGGGRAVGDGQDADTRIREDLEGIARVGMGRQLLHALEQFRLLLARTRSFNRRNDRSSDDPLQLQETMPD